MDDFPGLLARDFGFKPQGKSSPMVPPRGNAATTTSYSLGSGSRTSNSCYPSKSAPIFDDHDRGGGGGGADLLFNDVFGGPPKYTEPQPQGGGATPSSFDYDAMFNDQNAKSSSLPAYDKPVYDDDIFDGLPGIKSASSNTPAAVPASGKLDDVFASMGATASSPKRRAQNSSSSPFDDLLGNLGKEESTEQIRRKSAREKDASPVFDDLLPGFGRSSSPGTSRSISDSSRSQKPSSDLGRTVSGVMDDPFVILQSTSTAPTSSAVLFTDPSEDIGKFTSSGSTKGDNSYASKGVFDDLHHLENLGRSVPPVSSEINKRGKDQSPLRGGSTSGTYSPASKESFDKYWVENAEGYSQRTVPLDDFQESSDTVFDMPTSSSDFRRSARPAASPPSYVNASANETNFISKSEDISESSDDIWLTVLEIPLFTRPTSAPPPSRPPPPRPPRIPKSETGSFSSPNSRRKGHEYFSNSSAYSQVPSSACAERNTMSSQLDELEDFAMATAQNSVNEHADVFSEDGDASSAAAMKEAMGKAQAKFRQAREREYLKAARSKEAGQVDRDMQDMRQRESRERQERIDRERQQREKEEEEREQRRLEKEREREEKEREERRLERERERVREAEREREKARQAVERATREARGRAAAEAWMKAERAAAEKAATEARERTERAAVQRAQAEARERAAAEARERVEKAAAEARERANAEAREREAMERAAAAKAEADARVRAERAAVERVAAEARQRAAAAARANQQRNENQQKNENDLESFFSSRATSAPRTRASAADPFFDTQNKGVPEAAGRTSVGSTTNTRKASSAANIVDDLSSIFGAAVPSGEFQEVEGETEERRRARLERHQRTQERAAKALAEKNQRDLQVQREQAERHRIAETLDVEIKRWAAGKEGNLRALLSTLQYVLWPECGWQPVSLTDLIIAASVKKVYRKATLCIHPDKVQQKGANLQQKYVAEKVFDLLKEAWNKFNSEELF